MTEPNWWILIGLFIVGSSCIVSMFIPDKRTRQYDRRLRKLIKELERKSNHD